ncbi:MAG: T9SS type A sorting domain-containing protein [Bacteroidia bacterium]|nr:T9SS type A sorting domain-containing protein [Bacteroidia bacterium]
MKKIILSVLMLLMHSYAFSQITLTSTISNVSCFGGSNGSGTVTATGGTGPYTYTWTPTNTNSSIITGVAAGTYTVNVEDAVANTSSLVVNISQPTQINVQTNTYAACYGSCSGYSQVFAFGGAMPYTYLWSNGVTSDQNGNLCVGIYSVQVTSANGCTGTTTINIIQPPTLSVTANKTNATCNITCDGSASANITGGIGPFSYYWLPSGATTSSISNLCCGNYSLVVNDNGSQCSESIMFNIVASGNNAIPNTTITSIVNNETCFQSIDGSIDLSVSGSNNGPFTYLWSNGAITQDIYNLQSNIYSVTIVDANSNCSTIFDTVSSIGINCGTILGKVYVDNNSDCNNNTGDNNFQNSLITVNPGNRYAYTNSNGTYVVNNLPYGTYSITLNNNTVNIYPTCTTTINTSVSSGNPNSINNNLSIEFNSATQPDMQITGWNAGVVPGISCHISYSLENLNMITCSGILKITLPSSFIPNITNVIPSSYTISGDTILWNFSNITYSIGAQYYRIDFTPPQSTPLGSLFMNCAFAQASMTDFNSTNNTFCYQRMVTGSYDPNDKTVSPVGVGANGDIAATETDLTYLIRFQNTGNGPAVNIVVKDTLSPNVNINTFEMLGASHNYNIDILPGNVLRWKFNNIMLADSGTNEPASHGYIQYRIKRTNNNAPGTQIKNTAYIYFDFNAPVVTNTAINTIETITGIHSQSANENGWNVYPNPSTGALYIVNSSMLKEYGQIQVLNAMGQIVMEESMNGNYKNIELSKLNNGIYFVKITSDKQSVIKRIVLNK